MSGPKLPQSGLLTELESPPTRLSKCMQGCINTSSNVHTAHKELAASYLRHVQTRQVKTQTPTHAAEDWDKGSCAVRVLQQLVPQRHLSP